MSKKSINTEKKVASNVRADLISAAIEVVGMGKSAAASATNEHLVQRLADEGFDEEGLYASLIEDFGYGNYGMSLDISELCLPALSALWIECVQSSRPNTVARVADTMPGQPATKPATRYATSPREIVKSMTGQGIFTKAQMRDHIRAMLPDVKSSYLGTMLARLTNANNPLFKAAAVVNAETGVVTWAA